MFYICFQDNHWTTWMATENRVPCNHEPDTNDRNVTKIDNSIFLPSDTEQQQQKKNYISLIGRVLTSTIPCLDFLKVVSTNHIPHKYSDLTSKPTETVRISFYKY